MNPVFSWCLHVRLGLIGAVQHNTQTCMLAQVVAVLLSLKRGVWFFLNTVTVIISDHSYVTEGTRILARMT